MERCCGFTIETGGVIAATKNVLQLLYIIFLALLMLTEYLIVPYFIGNSTLWRFLLLILVIGGLCISILSIRGIEARNHRYIFTMLIWLVIAVVISLVLLMKFVVKSWHISVFSLVYIAIGLFGIALDVFGIVIMYNLYKKFRVQPMSPPSQYNQQPLQYTEKV